MELLYNTGIESNDYDHAYEITDRKITKLTRAAGICWTISILFLSGSPFMKVFLDYAKGVYTSSSWTLIYQTLYGFICKRTFSQSKFWIDVFHFRNPWDMTNEPNIILTVFLQACCAAPVILYFILIPQFLFFAITRYFDTFIEDVKMVITRFDAIECVNIKSKLVEMINLHWKSLEYDIFWL